jgi:hypothetical protein
VEFCCKLVKQELLVQAFLTLGFFNVMMPRRRNITKRFKACSDGRRLSPRLPNEAFMSFFCRVAATPRVLITTMAVWKVAKLQQVSRPTYSMLLFDLSLLLSYVLLLFYL